MNIGVELSPSCPPSEIKEHAQLLEECGFNHIWIRDMISASWELWSAVTAVVLHTEKVRVGIDVTNPYTRSPVVTAHAAATIDQLSRGRLDLGLGRGIPNFLERMGIEPQEQALEKGLQVIRELLRGGSTTFQEEPFDIRDIQIPILPQQNPLPVYVAAMDADTLRWAGRWADGVLTISAHEAYLQKAASWVKEGGRHIPIATWLPFSLSQDHLISFLRPLMSRFPKEFLDLLSWRREELEDTRLLESFSVQGPRDLEDKARRLEALGVTEIIIEYFALEELNSLRSVLSHHGVRDAAH